MKPRGKFTKPRAKNGSPGRRDSRGWLDNRKRHDRGKQQRRKSCSCGAYKYPHVELGGRCTLGRWVESFYDVHRRECADCVNNDYATGTCECAEGIESPAHCPELRDYIRSEGITLYGAARKAMDRAQRKS